MAKVKFVKSNQEREELLLTLMMRLVARRCPEDEVSRLATKLKTPLSQAKEFFTDQAVTQYRLMMKLFRLWREQNSTMTPEDAQIKFMHAIDLVDLPRILSKLKALRIYAKAPRL